MTESAIRRSSDLDRRDFIQQTVLALAAAQGLAALPARAQQSAPATGPAVAPPDNLVGIQMGPHTLLDEGIDHALDLIRDTAAINALFVYSHAYGGDLRKPAAWLATDHGAPPRDQRNRNLPLVWVRQHEQYFKDTTLRHAPTAGMEYADRDVFAELVAPARQRGMKIYPRILEAGPRGIVNFNKVVTITAAGRPTQTGCWNHPEYRAFWNATVEDLFRSYEVDGFQWGAERRGPLMNMILGGSDNSATCFCAHCLARGKASGIDPERARQGFADVAAYIRSLRAGDKPADGVFSGFLRLLLRTPEILAWEYQYRLAREEVMKGMYDTIKKIKPAAPVGWHIDHWASSMDPVARAEMSYAEMAPHSDFLKIVVYHAVTGPRTRSYLDGLHRGILAELPIDELFNVHYDLMGYDKNTEPTAAEANRRGFSPEYVFRETRHSVASAAGKTRIYPGVGFNLPQSPPDDPETIYQCVRRSYEAGASGIVASREYEEMTVPNLKAVGRAVRELAKPASPSP